MGDVNIDLTTLYYGIKATKTSKTSLNDLYKAVSKIKIRSGDFKNANLLSSAKSNIKNMKDVTISEINKRLETTKNVILKTDANAELLFSSLSEDFSGEFGEIEQEDFGDANSMSEVNFQQINIQQDTNFSMVEQYDQQLEKDSENLKNIQERIKELEAQKNSKQANVNINEYNNEIASLQQQYSELYQAMTMIKTLRDLIMESAFSMYMSYEDFNQELSNGVVSQISSYELKIDVDKKQRCIFYDEEGNVIEVSDIEALLYINQNIQDSETLETLMASICKSKEGSILKNTYSYLTEDEKKIAIYLLNTGNIEKLEEFFKFKEDHAYQRQGQEQAEAIMKKIEQYYAMVQETGGTEYNVVDYLMQNANAGVWGSVSEIGVYTEEDAYKSTLALLAKEGFLDGIKNYFNGIDNLFSADGKTSADQYKTSYLMQALMEKYGESGIETMFATGAYEISNSMGNMAPSMVIGLVTGCPMFGTISMGVSTTGNAREQGLQNGMTKAQSWLYGAFTGTSEAVLGHVLGSIPGISKVDDLGYLGKVLSEGLEESTQSILDPIFTSMITGQAVEIDWNEVTKSGIYGMITAGIMNGNQIIVDGVSLTVKTDQVETLLKKYKNQDLTNPNVIENLKKDLSSNTTENNKSSPKKVINTNSTTFSTDKISETTNNQSDKVESKSNTNNNNFTSNIEEQVSLANYYTAKGNFYTIKLNSLSEIPSDIWSKIDNPSNVYFNVNGQIMRYVEAKTANNPLFNNTKTEPTTIEEQVSLANYHTTNGNFYKIKVNSLNDIKLNDLINLKNKNRVLLQTSDGNIYDINTIESILNTSSQIKKELILSVSNIDDPILKARKLYVELNKKVHYKMEYIKGTTETKKSILDSITTFENLNDKNTIVCKGWSELYIEILKSCGFDESQLKIINEGKHRWVEIDLGNGKTISADATDAMNGSIDLANCKAGMQTNGFIILDSDYSGYRPSNIYKNKELNADFIDNQNKWLSYIDKVLGYTGENGYLLDELIKSENLFSNTKLYKKFFGTHQFNRNIDYIFDTEIPENMDGYEVYAFYNFYKNKLLGNLKYKLSLATHYRDTGEMIEPMNLMTYFDDNRVIIQLYSKSLGKIRFDNFQSANDFLRQFNLIE